MAMQSCSGWPGATAGKTSFTAGMEQAAGIPNPAHLS